MNIKKNYFWPLILFISLTLVGFVVAYFVNNKVIANFVNERTFTSELAINSLNPDQIVITKEILPNDISSSPDFLRLKKQVLGLGKIFFDRGVDAVYILAQKNDKIYFITESTPEGEPLYVLPGKLYEQAPAEINNVFKDGKTLTTDIYTDEYGTYLSQFSPIFNDQEEVVGVLGVDIDYVKYQLDLKTSQVHFWLSWFFLSFLLSLILLYFIKAHRSKNDSLASEQKIVSISNSIDDGIIVIDSKSEVTFWNKTSEKIFGYQFDQALGLNVNDLVKFNDVFNISKQQKVNKFTLSLNGQFIDDILEVKLKKDKRYFELHFSTTEINHESNLVCIFHDITLRKEAESKLEEQKEDFKNLNELMIGREMKMIELKKEIIELQEKNKKTS